MIRANGMRHLGAAVVTLVLCAAAPAPGSAQDDPVDAVRERNEAVRAVLRAAGDSIDDATRERLKDLINSVIDFQELSRRALGKYWAERSEAEREEFVSVFRELVRNSSVRKLEVHEADSIRYLPAEIDGDQATVTTVAYKDGESVEIVYRLHRRDGEWKAWDVIIDGSSTMRTYRDSFYREIEANGFQRMLQRLKERLEQERAGGSPEVRP